MRGLRGMAVTVGVFAATLSCVACAAPQSAFGKRTGATRFSGSESDAGMPGPILPTRTVRELPRTDAIPPSSVIASASPMAPRATRPVYATAPALAASLPLAPVARAPLGSYRVPPPPPPPRISADGRIVPTTATGSPAPVRTAAAPQPVFSAPAPAPVRAAPPIPTYVAPAAAPVTPAPRPVVAAPSPVYDIPVVRSAAPRSVHSSGAFSTPAGRSSGGC